MSQLERDDYIEHEEFRLAENTLEAKQFFRSHNGVAAFVESSSQRGLIPPYRFIFQNDIDDECLAGILYDERELDRYLAITIYDDDLEAFNNCVNFVDINDI